MMPTILPANPAAENMELRAELEAAFDAVLKGGRFILGPEVEAFEAEFAAYIGLPYGVGVGSGTEALHLALRALDIGIGCEVITVAHTAVATVAAIEMAAARPVLVDIQPDTYTIDVAQVEQAITPQTRAVIAVHLYGHPADLAPLLALCNRRNLVLIEDCAQAHGAGYHGKKVGCWGKAGIFSFYPTKNLGAIGDGGMVVSNDRHLIERLRALREYGWKERYISHEPGLNSRLDELQAAFLRVKLKHLDANNSRRARLASNYSSELASLVTTPVEKEGCRHAYHLYVVRTPQRDALRAWLHERGIGTLIHYPVPVHLQPAYMGRVACLNPLPVTQQCAREVLSLPLYPQLLDEHASRVIAAIQEFFNAYPARTDSF